MVKERGESGMQYRTSPRPHYLITITGNAVNHLGSGLKRTACAGFSVGPQVLGSSERLWIGARDLDSDKTEMEHHSKAAQREP